MISKNNKMKNFVLITITLVAFCSCQSKKKEGKLESTTVKSEISDSLRAENVFSEFKGLYAELLDFKDDSEFEQKGFGEGGPYASWLKKVIDLKGNPDSKLLPQKGVVAGELEMLGLQYASSKGKETESTKFFNDAFSTAINPKPEAVFPSGTENYDKIKQDYKLLGKWKITLGSDYAHPYEIYSKGDSYIGVWASPQREYKTEILTKKGNDYFIKGNNSKEYYKIDSKLDMALFDKDGELASLGCIAKKQ